MTLQENQKENFINFWKFLEIPMNSPIGDIKVSFASKFEKIKNSIDKGEKIYSPEDLKTCVNAYETLSNPYSRFLHNCEIDGEEPPKYPDWNAYFSDNGISNEDLSEENNQNFLAWLLSKAEELGNQMGHFIEIANKLLKLFIKEKEEQEKKEILQQRNKKILQQRNKKTMHK